LLFWIKDQGLEIQKNEFFINSYNATLALQPAEVWVTKATDIIL